MRTTISALIAMAALTACSSLPPPAAYSDAAPPGFAQLFYDLGARHQPECYLTNTGVMTCNTWYIRDDRATGGDQVKISYTADPDGSYMQIRKALRPELTSPARSGDANCILSFAITHRPGDAIDAPTEAAMLQNILPSNAAVRRDAAGRVVAGQYPAQCDSYDLPRAGLFDEANTDDGLIFTHTRLSGLR